VNRPFLLLPFSALVRKRDGPHLISLSFSLSNEVAAGKVLREPPPPFFFFYFGVKKAPLLFFFSPSSDAEDTYPLPPFFQKTRGHCRSCPCFSLRGQGREASFSLLLLLQTGLTECLCCPSFFFVEVRGNVAGGFFFFFFFFSF